MALSAREIEWLANHRSAKPTGALSWFGKALTDEEFLQQMTDEGRLVYEFEVERTYGSDPRG